MTLANRITLLRIILAPIFFALYFIPEGCPIWVAVNPIWIILLLWVIFIVAEVTDALDGMAARRLNQTSDFGRFFDPFADTLVQLTFFLCFVIDGIFPVALFLVVIYREFGILFIRNLMLKEGIAMGARMSGKVKTVAYIVACSTALVYASLIRLDILEFLHLVFRIASVVIFAVSVLISVLSFLDYFSVYRSLKGKGKGKVLPDSD